MANFKGITLPDGTTYFPEGSGSAIDTVSVSVDNNTGVPSATGSVSGTTLNLNFKNLKGETGSTGPQGDPGQGVPAGGTAGQVLKKKSGTDYDTEWADETGGSGGGTSENLIAGQVTLASGTIPAGQTEVNDDSFVDTGLTLSDLKQYKYFIIRIRLDDSKPYLRACINKNSKVNVIFYAPTNAVFALCEIDGSEKNILKILGGTGNSLQSNPNDIFLNNLLGCIGTMGNVSSIKGMLSIPNTFDNEHLYVGIGNMNGLDSTKYSATWDVVGIVKFG